MATATETVQVQQEVPKEGMITVPLSVIDNRYYINYRTETGEEQLVSLTNSIKRDGLMQNLCGTWVFEEGQKPRVALVSGFRRYECLCRIATQPIFDEYNKAKGFTPDQPGYLKCGGSGFDSQAEREKILADAEWGPKYQAALAASRIEVKMKVYKDDTDAELANMVENEVRVDANLRDRVNRVIYFLDVKGVKAKTLAGRLQLSEATVSQMKNIHSLPSTLRAKFTEEATPEETEARAKAEGYQNVADWKSDGFFLEHILKELDRRMGLPKNNDQVMGLSHMRELSFAIQHKTDPFPGKFAIDFLKDILKLNEAGEPSKEAIVDIGVFKIKLADMKKVIKLKLNPPPADPNAPAMVPSVVDQAATTQAATTPAAPVTTPAPAATAAAPAPAAPPATGDATKEAEINAANAAAGSVADDGSAEAAFKELETKALGSDAELADDALSGVDDTPVGTPETPAAPTDASAGQMKSKTVTASADSKRVTIAPEKVESQAYGYVADANEPEASPLTRMTMLGMASCNFDTVGLADQQAVTWARYADLVPKVESWITELEGAVGPEKAAALRKKHGLDSASWVKLEVPTA